jgi:hypothetical protein
MPGLEGNTLVGRLGVFGARDTHRGDCGGRTNTASRGVAESPGFKLDGGAEPWEYSESGVMLRYVLDAHA